MNTPENKAALIVAVGSRGEIGREKALLWHLPGDLQYFKRITMGHSIIMGRHTFESIGRALPGRLSIVVSRDADFRRRIDALPGCAAAPSLEQALDHAATLTGTDLPFADRPFITGGGQIYREALEKALVSRVYLTRVHAEYRADTFFPLELLAGWREISCERHPAQQGNPGFDYCVLVPPQKA